MDAPHACIELVKAMLHVLGKVRVYVIVIRYCIRTSCMTLYHVWIVAANAVARIIGIMAVLDDTCKPYMVAAQALDIGNRIVGDAVEFAASVDCYRGARHGGRAGVGKKTGEELIDDGALILCHNLLVLLPHTGIAQSASHVHVAAFKYVLD